MAGTCGHVPAIRTSLFRGIQAMPTFQLFLGPAKVAQVTFFFFFITLKPRVE